MAQFKVFAVSRCAACGKPADDSVFSWWLTNDAGRDL